MEWLKIFKDSFKMILSFSAVVQRYGEEILSAVPEDLRSGLKWEHVGSTSIKVQLLHTTHFLKCSDSPAGHAWHHEP